MPSSKEVKLSDLRLLILTPLLANRTKTADAPEVSASTDAESKALFSAFLRGLTGAEPSKDLTSFAGYTSHPPLSISNRYYSADVSIWCDELPQIERSADSSQPDLAEWTTNMRSDEATEVREVVGGIVMLCPYMSSTHARNEQQKVVVDSYAKYLTDINGIRNLIEDESGRDIATIVVVQDMTPAARTDKTVESADPTTSFAEKLEDAIQDHDIFGWDVVPWHPPKGITTAGSSLTQDKPTEEVNEFGEKLGMCRILEVLEQTNWIAPAGHLEHDAIGYDLVSTDEFLDLDDDDMSALSAQPRIKPLSQGSKDPVSQQRDEFQQEMMGLHFALEEHSQQETTTEAENVDELQVDQMTALIARAAEIREAGLGLGKEDRDKFARREVAKLMREMKID